MPTDANTLLLNRTDYGSDNDGTGSGADETTVGGAEIAVPHGGSVGIVFFLGEAQATIADTTETLDMIVEVSPDGGSTWGPIFTFRQITASELAGSGLNIDESAGGVTFRRGAVVRLPLADDGQNGRVKMRCNGTASDTNHWAPFVAIVSPADLRDEWLTDNVAV